MLLEIPNKLTTDSLNIKKNRVCRGYESGDPGINESSLFCHELIIPLQAL